MLKHSVPVYGYVPKEMKKEMKQISKADREKSESWMIEEGLRRLLPELRQLCPTHDSHRRKTTAA